MEYNTAPMQEDKNKPQYGLVIYDYWLGSVLHFAIQFQVIKKRRLE